MRASYWKSELCSTVQNPLLSTVWIAYLILAHFWQLDDTPLDLNSELEFSNNESSETQTVIGGSDKDASNEDQYYTKTFTLDNYNIFAGYIFYFNFFGRAEVKINNQVVWVGNKYIESSDDKHIEPMFKTH